MKPLYVPSGRAKEYGDYAVNIYNGCPHSCNYCYAPRVLKRTPDVFHSVVTARLNVAEELHKQIEREGITDKTIHLCFTCDPYPTGMDNTATRKVIEVIKNTGNHVQILTKGNGSRDFDLLDGNDRYGITVSTNSDKESREIEPGAITTHGRLLFLTQAKQMGIGTWLSLEPVVNENVLDFLREYYRWFDLVKIGKLNYHQSKINWAEFGQKAESLCKELDVVYYIKEGLRAEMNKPQ